MKLYFSADIEGVPGIQHWDECRKNNPSWAPFAEHMTTMVRLACEAAFEAGADEVCIKDAHSSGLNIDHARLPRRTRLIRGWSGHPFSMVQDIDASYSAVAFLGYHSAAGSSGNPLAHTMSIRIAEMRLNNRRCSEFLLYGTLAASLGVPTILVLGDQALCEHAAAHNAAIETVVSGQGVGDSVIGRHPEDVWPELVEKMKRALGGDLAAGLLPVSDSYVLELEFHDPKKAYSSSFFPGAEQIDERTVRFEAAAMTDIVNAVKFMA